MWTAVVVMLLCAVPQPVRVAATAFSASGEDEQRAGVWLDRFSEVMSRNKRVEVTTPSALAQMLGMERQRQLLGCADEAGSCMAELAAALGADGILSGSITRSGESYLAVVRVIRQQNAKVWWSASARVKGEGALLDWLDEQALLAAAALVGEAPAARLPVGALLVGGVGLAAAGVGAGFLGVANALTLPALRASDSPETLARLADAGKGEVTMGALFVGLGGAALATSVIWLIAAPKAPVQVAVVPSASGASVSLGGAW